MIATQPNLETAPAWLHNANLLWSGDLTTREQMDRILFLTPYCSRWLAAVRVVGVPQNESVCGYVLNAITEVADFTELVPPNGALQPVCDLHKRLNGLLGVA